MRHRPIVNAGATIDLTVGQWRDRLFADHLLTLDQDRPWYLPPTPEQEESAEWLETFLWPMEGY